MQLIDVDHPLVAHKVRLLRSIDTPSPNFRNLVSELVTLLAYEATRGVRVEATTVTTPLTETSGVRLSEPRPLVVPILRAGLGMLDGMMSLMPAAELGFVGMVRDEETLQPFTYAERLPNDLSGRQCYVLDPMLATGGSLGGTVQFLVDRGADDITCICLMAAPEGIEHLRRVVDPIGVPTTLVVAQIDERLNERGYIVPGLGDAGDRSPGCGPGRPSGGSRPAASHGRPQTGPKTPVGRHWCAPTGIAPGRTLNPPPRVTPSTRFPRAPTDPGPGVPTLGGTRTRRVLHERSPP